MAIAQTSSENGLVDGGCHSLAFLALRGVQAGREYFVSVCPLKLVPRLFVFDEPDLPPEMRAQRVLNAARVPEIARYLTENPENYVLSAITASIDGDISFQPLSDRIAGGTAGRLTIPLTAKLLVNDGQHRRAAIQAALEGRPELGDESIGVIFFLDAGLARSQQMFADLNRHAVRPTRSLGILYDQRDPVAAVAREIAMAVEPFKSNTETEKTSLSNRSTKVFTLSAIYQGASALIQGAFAGSVGARELEIALEYFEALGEMIRGWGFVDADVSAAELRLTHIHTHAVALHALGVAGGALIYAHPDDWATRMKGLKSVDWTRDNAQLWEGRALRNGRVSKAGTSVALTAIVIKRAMGVELSPEDEQIEGTLIERPDRIAA